MEDFRKWPEGASIDITFRFPIGGGAPEHQNARRLALLDALDAQGNGSDRVLRADHYEVELLLKRSLWPDQHADEVFEALRAAEIPPWICAHCGGSPDCKPDCIPF